MILRFLGRVADVAGELARTAVAIGEVVGGAAIERVRERRRYRPAARRPGAGPPPPQPPPPPPPAPVRPVRPAPVAPAAEPEPLVVVPEPTRGQAARIREAQREAERTDDSPGAEIHVAEPWSGYAAMNAPEIIDRVRVSDEAVRAVVALYERSHRKRKTVLRAAGAD